MPRRERHLKETTWIRSVHLLDADVFSRTTYISKCGAWGKALEAFAGFSAGRVEPSFVTYNALSSAFDRGSRWQEAGLVMTTMRADGVEADVVTYNTAFSALQTSSQWRNDRITFNSAITAVEHWTWALLLLDILRSTHVPNVITYSAGLSAFRQWRQASSLLESGSLRPNTSTYNSVAGVYDYGAWEEVMQILRQLDIHSTRADAMTFTAAAAACEKVVQWRYILHLLKAIDPFFVDMITLNSTLRACARGVQWMRAEQLLSEMQTLHLVSPDITSCNAAITSYGNGRQAHRALLLFEQSLEYRLEPSEITCNAILGACAKGSLWADALGIYDTLTDFFVTSSVIAYESVFLACELGGHPKELLLLLDSMRLECEASLAH
ncbi:Pentatricopeptide repeat-containing protein At1g06580 [Durusdinium trenchii]|uniref:Pentatricopeptide repeat-containing protein At1g06580 n=1 Tax=Durusdinium trenchii TaxID=1381693 RepID=A0ABP0HBI0_9DINO